MTERLINQNNPQPHRAKLNIAIKYRKKKPKPCTFPADSETTAENQLQHHTIIPVQDSDYIHYLSQSSSKPQQDCILNESNSNSRAMDHQVYKLLKRINLGKNFSQYINRKSKVNSKVMFQNSYLAENVNVKTSNFSIHKKSPMTKRLNTWMGCSQSPFLKRKSQMSTTQCRLTKRQRNRSLPDYSLKKILIATQFQILPHKQPSQSQAPTKVGNYQDDSTVKKRRNISYCEIR